jgi:predicted lysophospholipase L1 biosynthesis ABC-type transport system permease subunit
MQDNLKSSQLRAIQYWFADGLAELSGGVICLLLAIYFAVQEIIPASTGSFALIFLALFIAAYGIRKLMLSMRRHSTYPRTGYIELKKGWQNRKLFWVTIGFTVLLLGFLLLTILSGIQTMLWMPVIGGIIFLFLFFLAGYRTKLIRFYFVSGFSLLLGLFLSFSGLGDFWGTALLSLSTGLVLFAFGVVTRMDYLRRSSASRESSNGS